MGFRKIIVSKTPLKAEYELTEKGRNLDKALYEIVMFSMENYPNEVFMKPAKFDKGFSSLAAKKALGRG